MTTDVLISHEAIDADPRVAPIRAKIEDLKQQQASLEGQIPPLRMNVEQLEAELHETRIQEAIGEASADDVAALDEALSRAQRQLQVLEQSDVPVLSQAIERLEAQLLAAQQQVVREAHDVAGEAYETELQAALRAVVEAIARARAALRISAHYSQLNKRYDVAMIFRGDGDLRLFLPDFPQMDTLRRHAEKRGLDLRGVLDDLNPRL